jgi:hypothetical protein
MNLQSHPGTSKTFPQEKGREYAFEVRMDAG